MEISFLALSPASIEPLFCEGVMSHARENSHIKINTINIRDYATDKHHVVDDTPYGGGAGMLLKPDIVALAIEDAQQKILSKGLKPYVVLTSASGRKFTQKIAQELAEKEALIFICGQYEGIDERINCLYADDEISLGDFVLSGGEIAAAAIANAVCRLLPNVLGDSTSAQTDSFSNSLLEYPQFTRPAHFKGLDIPEILLSGDHAKIAQWRWEQAYLKTAKKRPDLLEDYDYSTLNKKQKCFIDFLFEQNII